MKPKPKRPSSRSPAAVKPRLWRLPFWADAVLRLLLAAYIALTSVVIRYHVTVPGLDGSWAFGLNYAAAKGLLHGRDIAFTYGPLAWLGFPMAIGSNLFYGLLAQAGLWLLFAATVAWLAFARRIPLIRLLLFALLLSGGAGTFYRFGYAGPDLFLALWMLLLLGCALEDRRWWIFYSAAVAVAAVLLLVKFSSGMLGLSALGGFAAAWLLLDRRKALACALLGGIGAPLVFAVLYLAYCPSFAAMGHYLRAGMEFSSGYSAVMSQEGEAGYLAGAGWIVLSYAALIAVLWWERQRSLVLAVACLGPLFVEFKHAMVRSGGHADIFFQFVPLVVGVVLLFTEFRAKEGWAVAAAAGLFLYFWYPYGGGALFPNPGATLTRARPLGSLWHLSETRQSLAAQSQAALAADRLPPDLGARIGGRPVAILPWEAAYAAVNNLNFRPLPVFQTYQAYTAYLDGWNAEFLENNARAPEFVILDWDSIDERHPLLDVPATSLALYRHYDFDGVYGSHLLLKRRAAPRFGAPRLVATRVLRRGEPLRFPSAPHPMVARLRLEPSFAGRMRQFWFRVPDVWAIFSGDMESSLAARIPPGVVSDTVPLNFLPPDFATAQTLFAHDQGTGMDALSLAGAGLDSFQPEIRVELFEVADLQLAPPPRDEMAGSAMESSSTDAVRFEFLNGQGLSERFANETIELRDPPGYVSLQGWAYDGTRGEPAGRVYVELDGKPLPARYGLPSPGIATAMRRPELGNIGFQWIVPEWKLGRAPHEVRLRVVTRDGKWWYGSSARLRFRIVR